jgi:hypothetical protein
MREPVRASDGCVYLCINQILAARPRHRRDVSTTAWRCGLSPMAAGSLVDSCTGVYDRHAITRWFSQRLSSPLTGEQLDSGRLDPCDGLRKRAEAWAAAHRHTREGAAFFGCRYCGDARCPHPEECQKTFESKARLDAAYGAALRRRAWFEGNVLPPAERALQSGPAGAGALMTGACLVGAVGALLGGVASSVAEVAGMSAASESRRPHVRVSRRSRHRFMRAGGGIEIVCGVGSQIVEAGSSAAAGLHGSDAGAPPAPDTTVEVWRRTRLRDQLVGDETATPFDRYHNLDPSRPSATRGCARIASAVTVLPVATVAATATCVVGVAVGAVTMTCGIVKEVVSGAAGAVTAAGEQLSGPRPPPTHQDEVVRDASRYALA